MTRHYLMIGINNKPNKHWHIWQTQLLGVQMPVGPMPVEPRPEGQVPEGQMEEEPRPEGQISKC